MAKAKDDAALREAAIKAYSDSIVQIKEFRDAVHTMPGMYIGEIGTKGYYNEIRELVSNAIDEARKHDSWCDHIVIRFNQRTLAFSCLDNGRGIPFDKLIDIYTQQHMGSNFTRKKFEFPSGLHGIGAKVVNAMSEKFIVESYQNGKAVHVEFNDGLVWDKGILSIDCNGRQGTLVGFVPNPKWMGRMEPSVEYIKEYISSIIRFTDIGMKVDYEFTLLDGSVEKGTIVNDDQMYHFIKPMVGKPLVEPIRIYDNTSGEEMIEVLFTYDLSDMTSENHIVSFMNTSPTETGYHIDGTYNGITKWFSDYMNKIYLESTNQRRKTPLKCIPTDVKTGLKIVLNGNHIRPIFDGQAKTRFAVVDYGKYATKTIIEFLNEWAKTHKKELDKIASYLKNVIEIRMSSDEKKVQLNTASNSSLTHLPAKFVPCTGDPNKEELELYLAEGDSAGGSIHNGRNPRTQAYYPLRGKTPNPFGMSPATVLANEELSGIVQIIGAGWGKSFDISKARYKKIIIMTDADVDGKHICTLLLRFFAMYMPGLIENGYVYIACPPLYGIRQKKEMVYLTDLNDFVKYEQSQFCKKHTIQHMNGKRLTGAELEYILTTNQGYTEALSKPAAFSKGAESFIEYLLIQLINNLEGEALLNKLIDKYRFVSLRRDADSYLIEVSIGMKRYTIFVNNQFMYESRDAIKYITLNNEFEFLVDGKPISLIELMMMFDNSKSSVGRYKGLGEMSGKALYDSSMDPSKRTFVRVGMESKEEAINHMTEFDANIKKTLLESIVSRADIT